MGSHQEGQDARGGQMIEQGEARLDVKAAKTTRSLLAVVPKDDRGRTWSQAVRKEGEVFPIACSNELFQQDCKSTRRPEAPSSSWESFLIGIHTGKSGRSLDRRLSCRTPSGNVCNQERCTVHRF